MSTLHIAVPIDVYYSNKKHVPIKDIIKSLEGIDGLSQQFYTVASELLGYNFHSSTALIENIESGSLSEKVLIFLNFKDEEEFEKFLNDFGKDHPVIRNVLTFALISLILYGLYKAIPSESGVGTQIEGNNNVVININNQRLTDKEINAIIEKSLIDKKAAVNSSLKMISPAKRDNQAHINIKPSGIENHAGFMIEQSLIAKAPETFKEPIEEKILHIESAQITIRAIDLDKRNQGWAGLVAGIDRRLPITIAPNVDISKLRDTTIVDLSVMYMKNENDDNLRPVRIYIEGLAKDTGNTNLARKVLTQEEAEKMDDVHTSTQIHLPL